MDQLGISGPKEQHSGKCSGFSSYATCPRLGTGKARAQKCHTETAPNNNDRYFNLCFTVQVLNVMIGTYSTMLRLTVQAGET